MEKKLKKIKFWNPSLPRFTWEVAYEFWKQNLPRIAWDVVENIAYGMSHAYGTT